MRLVQIFPEFGSLIWYYSFVAFALGLGLAAILATDKPSGVDTSTNNLISAICVIAFALMGAVFIGKMRQKKSHYELLRSSCLHSSVKHQPSSAISDLEEELGWRVVKPNWRAVRACVLGSWASQSDRPIVLCVGLAEVPKAAGGEFTEMRVDAGRFRFLRMFKWIVLFVVLLCFVAVLTGIVVPPSQGRQINPFQVLQMALGGLVVLTVLPLTMQLTGFRNKVSIRTLPGILEVEEAQGRRGPHALRRYSLCGDTVVIVRSNPTMFGNPTALAIVGADSVDVFDLSMIRKGKELIDGVLRVAEAKGTSSL